MSSLRVLPLGVSGRLRGASPRSMVRPPRKSSETMSPFVQQFEIQLQGTLPQTITILFDHSGQHTITWESDVSEANEVQDSSVRRPSQLERSSTASGRAWREAKDTCDALTNDHKGPLAGVGPRPTAQTAAVRWRAAAAARANADLEAKRWRAEAARAKSKVGGGVLEKHLELPTEADLVHTLPRGSCNLYVFPTSTSKEYPKGSRPSAGGLRILQQIVLQLAVSTCAFEQPDEVSPRIVTGSTCQYQTPAVRWHRGRAPNPRPRGRGACLRCSHVSNRTRQVGAYPIHSLLVCNSPESVALAMELYAKKPSLLPLVHVQHRSGLPLFVGESSLHVLAVNRHEDEHVALIELVRSQLSAEQASALFCSQAEGVFFRDAPMFKYGGSALSYAVAFEMPDAVRFLSLAVHTCGCECVHMLTGRVRVRALHPRCVLSSHVHSSTCTGAGLALVRCRLDQRQGACV